MSMYVYVDVYVCLRRVYVGSMSVFVCLCYVYVSFCVSMLCLCRLSQMSMSIWHFFFAHPQSITMADRPAAVLLPGDPNPTNSRNTAPSDPTESRLLQVHSEELGGDLDSSGTEKRVRKSDPGMQFVVPPSLKPLIPILVCTILTSAGQSIVSPILPKQRNDYFGDSSKAVLYSSIFEAGGALIGFFTGGLFGLAADVYGRKIILLISAFQAALSMSMQCIFGASNPWPFLVGNNFSPIVGSTKIGNAAVGFMVVADLFEVEHRLLPMVINIMMIFVGVAFAPVPSALGMSDEAISLAAMVILLLALIFVWLFFEETLPPHKRKQVSVKDLENPIVPLRHVFKNKFLTSLAIIGSSFFYPFSMSLSLALYYLDDKIDTFTSTDNGTINAIMAVCAIVTIVLLLPRLLKWMWPENVVLLGMAAMAANQLAYCLVAKKWQAFAFIPTTEALSFAALSVMTQMVSVAVPVNEQGVVNGALGAVKEVATILGPVIGSGLYSVGKYHIDREHPFIQLPFLSGVVIALCGLFVNAVVLRPLMTKRRIQIAAERLINESEVCEHT